MDHQYQTMINKFIFTEESEEKYDVESPEFGSPINYSFSRENNFISTFQDNDLINLSNKFNSIQK